MYMYPVLKSALMSQFLKETHLKGLGAFNFSEHFICYHSLL